MSSYYTYEVYSAYYGKYGKGETEELDSRLVAVCIPARNMYPLNTQMSGQTYDYEDGVINSDGGGVQGVIDEGETYIGEGYENLYKPTFTLVNCILNDLGNGFYEMIKTSDIGGLCFAYSNNKVAPNTEVSAKWEIKEGFISDGTPNGSTAIRFNSPTFTLKYYYSSKGEATETSTSTTSNADVYLRVGENIPKGHKIIFKLIVSETSQPVPFVKTTAPDGRLVINESWTSATHSYIFVGCRGFDGATTTYVKVGTNDGSLSTFEYISALNILGRKFDLIASNLYKTAIIEDDTEETVNIGNVGVGNVNNFTRILASALTFNVTIKIVLIYNGILTEQELRDELAKIKRNKYRIPSGVSKVLSLS